MIKYIFFKLKQYPRRKWLCVCVWTYIHFWRSEIETDHKTNPKEQNSAKRTYNVGLKLKRIIERIIVSSMAMDVEYTWGRGVKEMGRNKKSSLY